MNHLYWYLQEHLIKKVNFYYYFIDHIFLFFLNDYVVIPDRFPDQLIILIVDNMVAFSTDEAINKRNYQVKLLKI